MTPLEILKKKYLLIENDMTCECHTHLVIEAMEEYSKQQNSLFLLEIKKIEKQYKTN